MPKKTAKKAVTLPKKLTMEQCRTVREKLERDIKKLSLPEQKELNDYIREHEDKAKKTGKELQPGLRLSLITYWFVKKGKKV